MEQKIWILIRSDLVMSPGKIAVQSCHAVLGLAWLLRETSSFFRYMQTSTPKIAVSVQDDVP
jgi:peptidyl-tRNA hydrolase